MKPVFIGGTGRSGTTILKRILSSHSKVVSLPDELRVIVDPGGALDLISALSEDWSPYKADLAIHRFREIMQACGRSKYSFSIALEKAEKNLFRKIGLVPRRYLGMGLAYFFGYPYYHQRLEQLTCELSYYAARGSWAGSPAQLLGRIFESEPKTRQNIENIIRKYFSDLYSNVTQKGQTHWLDDTPYNILHVREMLSLFPDMRLIHIYRDPRDVLASYLQFEWGGDSFAATARRLAGIYQRWTQLRELLPAYCYMEVSLEQLSDDPQKSLDGICRFLGLEFESNLTQIPLDKVHAGRWLREIPKTEKAVISRNLDKYISLYGYETGVSND